MASSDCSRLRDRVALVTGAAHGIGRAYARRLADEGARVVIADLDGEGAERVAAELAEAGHEALGVRCDVGDEDAVRELADRALDRFGKLDIAVNNAGIMNVIPVARLGFEEISLEEWDRMMRVNLTGTWLVCKAVAPAMREQRYGKIINVSSGTVFKGLATRVHYIASKSAIIGFTRVLARELGEYGVTVNTVAPGSTLSEEDPDEATVAKRAGSAGDRAIKRVQRPDDLVGAVAFLASPDSDFITGQTLVVDGGSAMH